MLSSGRGQGHFRGLEASRPRTSSRTPPLLNTYHTLYCVQECRSLLSIGGGIISNFTPILPYFQLWGDEPRPRFFSGTQIKWRPKKKIFTKNGRLFSRNQVDTYAQMHTRIKLLGGYRCRPCSNYWGDTVKLLGGIYPQSSPGFGTPDCLSQIHCLGLLSWSRPVGGAVTFSSLER